MLLVRTLWIDTVGARCLRVRLPRVLITAWWKAGPHVRFLWLPRGWGVEFRRAKP